MALSDHPPFAAFVAPARTRPGWWRPVSGFCLIVIMWILGVVGALALYVMAVAAMTGDFQAGLLALGRITEGGDPIAILVILASFGGIWLGCLAAQRLFHGLPFGTLMGRLNMGGFTRGLLIGLGFAALSIVATLLIIGPPQRAVPLSQWLVFVVPVLVLVFIQATGEELIFRGYLLQQIAVRVSNPLAWAVLPSLGFGFLHYNAALPDGGGLFYVGITFMTGVALAACVWRTGDLWAASGIHVGINLSGLLFVGSEGILWGTQLYTFPKTELGGIFLVSVCASAALLAFVLSPLGRVLTPRR